MAKIEGLSNLITELRRKKEWARDTGDVSVSVGFTAHYAIYVHEAVGMVLRGLPRRPPRTGNYWDPAGRGQAKFLEQPFRELAPVFKDIVVRLLDQGRTLEEALLMCGLRLQREAMLLVPVETGNLKASAFTRVEKPAVVNN